MSNELFRDHLDGKIPSPRNNPRPPIIFTDWQRDFLLRFLAPTITEAAEKYRNLANVLIDSGIMLPPLPTEPKARALAAKQRRGHGPPSAASWRGRERTTKFRSQ